MRGLGVVIIISAWLRTYNHNMSQWVRKFDRNIPPLDYNDENLLTGVTHTREGKFTLKITLVRNLVKLPKGKYLSYIGTTKKLFGKNLPWVMGSTKGCFFSENSMGLKKYAKSLS